MSELQTIKMNLTQFLPAIVSARVAAAAVSPGIASAASSSAVIVVYVPQISTMRHTIHSP